MIRRPTPIIISRRIGNALTFTILFSIAALLWLVPIIPVALLGGFAIAMAMSFPVDLLSRFMPRRLAIFIAFTILILVFFLIAYLFLPMIVSQMAGLAKSLPDVIGHIEQMLTRALVALDRNSLLPDTPEIVARRLGENLRQGLHVVTRNVLGGTVGLVFGTFNIGLTIFAAGFVAVSLLTNVRALKAAYLAAIPYRHRYDALDLWNQLKYAFTRYLGGLALILGIQGALSAIGLYLIGLPYPLALGAWVFVTAVVPYLGPWLGAAPAILIAASMSLDAVILTGLVFVIIQLFEGNFLTPRIQGKATGAPSVVIFLAVIAGGTLFGFLGLLFSVPAIAVSRVFLNFFRVRLRMAPGT